MAKKNVLKKMLDDLGTSRKLLVICILLLLIEKICLIAAPGVGGALTDYLQESISALDISHVVNSCLELAVLYLLGYGLDGLVNRNMVSVAEALVRKLRDRAAKKINRLPLEYLDTHPEGDVLSRVTTDVITFSSSMESTLPTALGSAVQLIGVVVMMLYTNARLTLIYVIVLPITFLLGSFIMKAAREEFKKQQASTGEMDAFVTDVYNNHLIVKTFGCEEKKRADFDDLNKKFYKSYVKSRFFSGFVIPTAALMNNVAFILLCIISAIFMVRGELTLGSFQAFIFYGNMIGGPISSLASSLNQLQSGITAINRIYEFLDEKEMEEDKAVAKLDVASLKGSVAFDHVRFGYTADRVLMHDVSFEASPGQTMAIVGPSGAGKTTLVNLLLRFYDISGGTISLDGCDIKTISRSNLREGFGVVLQDTWIFDGTIAENIGYGKPDAPKEEIIHAAKTAQAHEFIVKLPDGYDTRISQENSSLSAGEKQLIAIARVVLSDPAILILDEATSQVDTWTEYLITKAMNKLMKGRTSFMIAHRLFTIQNADKIIFMVDGDIKEIGNHKELMQLDGLYASMYKSASNTD